MNAKIHVFTFILLLVVLISGANRTAQGQPKANEEEKLVLTLIDTPTTTKAHENSSRSLAKAEMQASPNEKIDSHAILEHAEKFYSKAFDHLLQYLILSVSILGVIVGIIMPAIISFFQNKELKLAEGRFHENQSKKLTDIESRHRELISEQIAKAIGEERKKSEQALQEIREMLSAKTAKISHGVFHVQGNHFLSQKDYASATFSFIRGAQEALKGGEETGLKRALAMICEDCFPNCTKEHLEDSDVNGPCSNLVESLSKWDGAKRNEDEIRRFNEALAAARKRVGLSK